ncbi:class I SAM-dependent methyltransferase [Rubrivirga sp. IMCC43871]|uniref:class I SAM-dependent methyltransferase n=1 Tax=Rubrivirga sp. IMCC43871 TaxID=3391575 RepID=UPI00399039AB
MSDWDTETAERYAQRYGDYPTNRLAVNALDLAADSTIVDVGCGTGSALRNAAARVSAGTLIGVDPVPRMIEIAREQTAGHPACPRIAFHEGRAEQLPLDTASADVVLAFDSFDHWADKPRGLHEIRRVLRRHGRLAVVKDGGVPGGLHARKAFADLLTNAGFEVLREREIAEADVWFTLWECSAGGVAMARGYQSPARLPGLGRI